MWLAVPYMSDRPVGTPHVISWQHRGLPQCALLHTSTVPLSTLPLVVYDRLEAAVLCPLCVNVYMVDLSRTFDSFRDYYRVMQYFAVSLFSLCGVPWCAQSLPPTCLLSSLLGTHSLKVAASMSRLLPQSKALALIHHRWVVHTSSNASGCGGSKLYVQ